MTGDPERVDCAQCGWTGTARTPGAAKAARIDHAGYCLPRAVMAAGLAIAETQGRTYQAGDVVTLVLPAGDVRNATCRTPQRTTVTAKVDE